MTARNPDLGTVMAALVESGIQVAFITSLPKSIDCHIGDEKRGPVAQKSFKPFQIGIIAGWFIDMGRAHYPKSDFYKIEWNPGTTAAQG